MPSILREPPAPDLEAGLPIPMGRRIDLPGRGTTFVRDVAGPPGAPTLILLHGWIASGGINWYQVFGPASEHFRVVAPDLRGHGRGIRSSRRFRLADCADDVAAICDELAIERAIVVGYSMGGPVAQLMWRRHRSKVAGLVLAATSHAFVPGMRERMIFTSMMATLAGTTRVGALATHLPRTLVKQLMPVTTGGRPDSLQRWAAAEIQRHDLRMLLEAGHAIGHYNAKRWIGDVDVPTAVLVTAKDKAVTPGEQAKMAFAIPHATIHRVEDGHVACTNPAIVPPLLDACFEVGVASHPGWHPERRRRSRRTD